MRAAVTERSRRPIEGGFGVGVVQVDRLVVVELELQEAQRVGVARRLPELPAHGADRIRRQVSNRILINGHPKANLARASQYLLEEAAYCGYLVDKGWTVLVYPGAIDPFKAVCEGRIPAAPISLRRLIMISLKLKRVRLPGEDS